MIACPSGCYPCADTYPESGTHAPCCCGGGSCRAPEGQRQTDGDVVNNATVVLQVLQKVADEAARTRRSAAEARRQADERARREKAQEVRAAKARAADQARLRQLKDRQAAEIKARAKPKLVDYTPARANVTPATKVARPEGVR